MRSEAKPELGEADAGRGQRDGASTRAAPPGPDPAWALTLGGAGRTAGCGERAGKRSGATPLALILILGLPRSRNRRTPGKPPTRLDLLGPPRPLPGSAPEPPPRRNGASAARLEGSSKKGARGSRGELGSDGNQLAPRSLRLPSRPPPPDLSGLWTDRPRCHLGHLHAPDTPRTRPGLRPGPRPSLGGRTRIFRP